MPSIPRTEAKVSRLETCSLMIAPGLATPGQRTSKGTVIEVSNMFGRFGPRTPIPGFYLCGAATHPGGSVIGVNGRNAALAVLADTTGAAAPR